MDDDLWQILARLCILERIRATATVKRVGVGYYLIYATTKWQKQETKTNRASVNVGVASVFDINHIMAEIECNGG